MQKLRQAKWLFFDVGDTLIDESAAVVDWCGQVSRRLGDRGIERSAEQIREARERAYTEMAGNIYLRIFENLSLPAELAEALRGETRPRLVLERPFPGAGDVLRELSRRYRIGIIANQPAGTQDRLRLHGWGDFIAECISSAEEGLLKPDPRIFHLALSRTQCSARDAVMIGDRIDNDIRPAKALGMRTVRLRQGASRFQQPRDAADEADVTIDDIRNLLTVLRAE